MSELTTDQLIKIIIGIAVVVVVIVGVSFFFGGKVKNFLNNLPGEDVDSSSPSLGSSSSGGVSSGTTPSTIGANSPRTCESCGFWCSQNECDAIRFEWVKYSRDNNLLKISSCQYTSRLFFGGYLGTCSTV